MNAPPPNASPPGAQALTGVNASVPGTDDATSSAAPAARLVNLCKKFAAVTALDTLSAELPTGRILGLVGPDGAGKTTLIRLLAGLMEPTSGSVEVLGRKPSAEGGATQAEIGYMPQRFGLYEDLSVLDNLTLYANLRALDREVRRQRFAELLEFTSLAPFTARLAGKLSGGMKQKLGLACALLGRPRLLLLDEPGVGVDPLSRRELWRMVTDLMTSGVTVLWSTAYLEEAERCSRIWLLDGGRLLHDGAPRELSDRMRGRVFRRRSGSGVSRQLAEEELAREGVVDAVIQGASVRIVAKPEYAQQIAAGKGYEPVTPRLEDAYIELVGGAQKGESLLARGWPTDAAHVGTTNGSLVECHGLTKRFGTFVAADHVSFEVRAGEIYGLLGPNGAGKSTTFRMLCGLLKPTEGDASVAGVNLLRSASRARARLGYMAQKFSLYGALSVAQNLDYFAEIYGLNRQRKRERVQAMIEAFALAPHLQSNAATLPLGFKQRLALACATLHAPAVLFLDEPTSGVDPLMRREFWHHINAADRARRGHRRDDALHGGSGVLRSHRSHLERPQDRGRHARCPESQHRHHRSPRAHSRGSLHHAHRTGSCVSDGPIFDGATSSPEAREAAIASSGRAPPGQPTTTAHRWRSWWRQLSAVMLKEAKQVTRDPSSWIIAVFLPLTFLFLFGYGLSLDTTVVKIAVVREDSSQDARAFAARLEDSKWFLVVDAPDRASGKQLLRDQAVKATIIIPGEFGHRLYSSARAAQVQVLVDGAEPNTANFVRGYVGAIWAAFIAGRSLEQGTPSTVPISVEPRYWFNANAESRWFLIPGSITVIMTLIGTLLTALVIAREWERGTLEALYATPLTRGQILIGKTLPYFVLAMISTLVCVLTALILFHLPLRGSMLTLGLVAAVFLVPALGQGMLISVTMRSQLAAAQLGLMTGYLPAIMLSGFLFDIHSMPAVAARHHADRAGALHECIAADSVSRWGRVGRADPEHAASCSRSAPCSSVSPGASSQKRVD